MLQRAFLLSVLIACGSIHARTFDDDRAQRRMVAQQASTGELRNQGQTLESRIRRLEEDLGSRPLLELHSQIENLRLDLNRLQGQIEVLVNENELAQKRQRDFYVDLDNRLRRLEQAEGTDGSAAPRSSVSSPAASSSAIDSNAGQNSSQSVKGTAPVPAPVSALASEHGALANRNPAAAEGPDSRAYESGYDLFKTGKYKEAISSFNSFLRAYPESNLAASAHYWIGNSFYALRDFKNSVAAQETLIKIYPDSPKVPDAMLNIASSQLELNKKDAARTTLESVIVKYPGSDAADKAKRRLASIK